MLGIFVRGETGSSPHNFIVETEEVDLDAVTALHMRGIKHV